MASDEIGSAETVHGNPRPIPGRPVANRKAAFRDHMDRLAPEIQYWRDRNRFYHDTDIDYLRFLIPEGRKVLNLGCGNGETLAAIKPGHGVGVDISNGAVEIARQAYPALRFVHADFESDDFAGQVDGSPFDFILLSDSIGFLDDCQTTLENLHALCDSDTRVLIGYYSHLWEPILQLGQLLGMKMPQITQNFLRKSDIENILILAGYEVVKQELRILCPKRWFGLGRLINRYLAALPGIRRLCLRNYTVARSLRHPPKTAPSVSVVIPCRNEKGNIATTLARMPEICADMEVIFVEGNSEDGTLEEIERVIRSYKGPLKLSASVQDGTGKGDAVRKGFEQATGDILMILDADLTVAPEDLPKFYDAMVEGKGEFINGSRLVYPMEEEAMRFLNLLANTLFARLFSWLLNQRITDTLCGTKVLYRRHYENIRKGRDYFGEFDPFGDFDLIFGASKQNLKFREVPIRYASRRYGETQIRRFRHGCQLIWMVVFAFRKLKAF